MRGSRTLETSELGAAPHPNPLPASGEKGIPSAGQHEHRLLAQQIVRRQRHPGAELAARSVERDGPLHARAHRLAQLGEVLDGAQVDVGRHVPGLRQVLRHRHPPGEEEARTDLPMPEVGERDDGVAADAQELLQHLLGPQRGLDGEAQDGVVEGIVGVVGEIAVGVALDHGEPARHAGIDPLALDLDAAPIHSLGVGQELQQRAVAAPHVEHARALRHHLGDQEVVGAIDELGGGCQHQPSRAGFRSRRRAAALRKPRMVANSSGSSSRKASWPLSDSISTKLTLAATAFSACTISRLSRVG